ncbi:hypothetical protein KC318_g1757 [Hortaea werneckii]|nr:hypothetical protein KC334_g6892 [Hortaea werneckii]KAI7023092.1 hypothetical protein KC355_g1840 [Hortaea werneckii]KAI7186366.1 hypothetical protein KC324_g7165 [Hortaea werneckii]KAI7583114.1 hypothetical protein KC316_g7471 [Hortaea werneckii]KAI7674174.1 hypothetical protein KC318_g1757 [Hortaea werneckii]
MAHVNPHNGKPWSQSPEYIFAFGTQNEAMDGNEYPDVLADWQCKIAGAIKGNLQGRSDILVSTGGGSYLATSAQGPYFSCAALDVVAIHAYGSGRSHQGSAEALRREGTEVWQKAHHARVGNVLLRHPQQQLTYCIGLADIPWMYWQIIPNGDPHYGCDYEVGMGHQNWGALKAASQVASQYAAAFDFSECL